MNIVQAMQDPRLFGEHFAGDSWKAWKALLGGFYGVPMGDTERGLFERLTGLKTAPDGARDELWLIVGRRGGKSHIAALLAVYEAVFRDHAQSLAAGEVATVAVIAADRKQARTVFRYIAGLLRSNPMLTAMIQRETADSIELSTRVVIEVGTASHRSTRGYSYAAVICDEIAFWRDEGANPDREIIAGVRPGLATLSGKLIALSSPYARRGVLWEQYKRYYGKPGSILVAQAPSLLMNPSLPQSVVDRAYAEDPASAAAEYGAEFRTDIESFISRDAVQGAVMSGINELPPLDGVEYRAFVDPAGGSGQDSFTLAIAHREGDQIVIDAVRAIKPPFSPEATIDELAELVRQYRISQVTGDRWGGEFPRELFRNRGIAYYVAEKSKSDLYRDALPLFNSGRVSIPDSDRLINELAGLERKTARGGRDSIDHAPNSHDDLANACAGVLSLLARKRLDLIFEFIEPDPVFTAESHIFGDTIFYG